MPETPIYNPNNIVRKEPAPVYNPNNIVKKEVVDTRNFTEDANVAIPSYVTPQDLEIDSTLNFIQENSLRNMRDDEKDILKNMMKNPLTSKEELSDAIVTLQGKKAKQIDNSWTTPDYYMKRDENSGNYKPVALEQGEKIPPGYHAASIWGTKESAKDDNAWQDIGKSLANGVVGLMGGVVDVAQSGYELATGEESETLRSGKNAIEGLKFDKDADLERPVYNMEGITKWADLLDKDRFDFSPQALWGTFNSTAESLAEFGLGSLTGATWIKGAKAFKYGYKGVDTALDLGKAGKLGAIFTGSFFTNIGETRDAAEEAGLQGRDKGAVSLGIATVKSAIDAAFGLEGKIMSNAFKSGEREVLKSVIKKAETDAVTGLLTKNGFKQVMKDFTTEYSTLAKVGLKSGQVVKDMIEEGGNEVATDFAQKAGEQLWDKLTPDERGQFGTDAFSAESFGSYVNSFTQGAMSGGMMSVPSQILKNNHDRQSVNAYERVKEGKEAVDALRTDLNNALDKGEITTSEYEQAMFKIDAYSKYNEETKDVNLKPEDEKKAFELSFQIEGLKTEIPTNENEISKLDPIPRSKVEGRQSQVKKLQKELTEIIERGQVKGEPVVAKQTEEKIIKDKEKEIKEEETNSKLSQEKEVEKPKTRQSDIEGLGKEKVITYPKLENKPYWKDDKRTYEEIDTEEFNNPSTDARTIHRVVRKEAYNKPNKKLFGNLTKRLYSYVNDNGDKMKGDVIEVTMEDGKKIRVASSKQEFKDENDKTVRWDDIFRRHFRSERTQGNEEGLPVGIRAVDLNNPFNEDRGKDYKPGKIALKVFDARTGKFLSWAKETKTGSADSQDKLGNELYTAEQKELLKTLEQQMYNETPEGGDVIERLTKPKPKPTPTEKAKVATDKIVEEAKAKVKEQKASVPLTITKAVRQQLYDLGFTKANVDLMKPERALEIINKQETNKTEKVKSNIDKFEVLSYKEFQENDYNPENQLKFNQGESYEPVFIISNPEIKKMISDGSKILSGKDSGMSRETRKELEEKYGITTYELNKKAKELAKKYRDRNEAKFVVLELKDGEVVGLKEDLKLNLKEKENGKQESAVDREKSIGGNNEKTNGEGERVSKEIKLKESKGNKDRKDRGIKDPFRKKAADFDPANAYESVITYFAGKGFVSMDSLRKFFKETKKYTIKEWVKTNTFKRQNLTQEGAPTIDEVANKLWENQSDRLSNLTTEDYKDALEEVLRTHTSPIDMSKELLKNNGIDVDLSRLEEITMNAYETADKEGYLEDLNNVVDYLETLPDEKVQELVEKDKWEQGTDIVINDFEEGNEPFQKVSSRKGDISKVIAAINKALPKVNIVEKDLDGRAGRWNPKENTIEINPNYAGLDTPIHEAAHVFIDAIGYDNKIIQAAIKQLKTTPLYEETKKLYGGLDERGLDIEVLAEAIGREGTDIFDKVEDRSKFKAYLDYIFDWLKQKLGMDKNIAKSLSKQILGGVKTSKLEAVKGEVSKDQKVKEKKKPFADQALKYNQYATAEGFDAQKEFDKYEEASVIFKEAKLEEKLAEEAADEAITDEEIKIADAELEEKRALLKEASKEFAIKAKKYLGYLKYKKDFRAVQAILEDKDLDEYTDEELTDLITKLFGFNDRAAKAVKERAYQKLGHRVTVKQNEIHKKNEGFIEALGKTSDISPLQAKILHISHASEKNADLQALALASGKAIIEKLSEANSLKDTHAKLGLKVIQEENKRLGITGKAANRFSSDSSKYFEWMINEDGNYLTIDEAKAKGLSKAKLDYLDFHRETVAGYRKSMSANDYENVKMAAIRVDKNFREAYKSEGLIPAFSYYLGGGATNLGRVRILHNGKIMSYSEIEKEIIAGVDKKSIKSIAKALYDLLVANIKARYQLKKGQNIDEKDNPLELKGDAEYSLNEKGQLVSKFDKPRAKDRGYSKDFYKAMNQFIDESAHVKHISKIMPLVEAVEYLNKHGYMEEGYIPKKNVSKWINDWKALHIFKEPHVNDPVIDAAVKSLRKLVASTTMWFNIPANTINVFVGNYNNWRAENAETLAKGNARLFGGKGSRKEVGIVNDYALGIIKKYNLVNQDFDSHPVIKAGSVFSKLATWGTQVGEYQIQGSLGLGLLSQEEFDSFEWKEDKYGNKVLKVKEGVDEDKLKAKMTQVKNRVTDIQGKYPDEDRRNIMRGEFGKALFQFKVWMPDWFKERFGARYINAYGQEKEGSYVKMLRVGIKEMKDDLKKGDIKKALTNPAFVQNLKGMATIGALLALKHSGDDDDEEKKKGGLNWDSMLSQVLFIFDLEQDKYMVSNPAAVLGKIKDMLNAFEALVGFEEDAWQKTKRMIPGGKAVTFVENQIK